MSWSKRTRKPAIAAAAAVLALAGLAACGYKPLYGDNSTASRPEVRASMADVQIMPIRDRVGQLVRNSLIDRMTPAGQGETGRYRLDVRLEERREELAIRRDETATRANLHLTAVYRLHDNASGAVVSSGTSFATTSYNLVRNEFAAQSALRDARQRGADLIAEDITYQVAAYFNRRQQNPNRDE